MKRLHNYLAGGLAVLTMGLGSSALADVIASESFDYTGNTINNQGGAADGWGGAWVLTPDGDNFHSFESNSSLSYPAGVVLTPSGGHISNMSNEAAYRPLATSIDMDPASPRELWISMLVNKSDTGNITFGFERNDGLRRVVWGFDVNERFGVRIDGDTPSVKTTDTFATGTDLFVVIKLNLLQGPTDLDTISLKVFGPGDPIVMPVNSSDFDVTSTAGSGIVASRFFIQGTSQVQKVDEIRIGDSFADVAPVPEPASAALGTLGLLLMMRRP